MAVSNIVGAGREIRQFGTSVFVEAQEKNFRGTLEVNMMILHISIMIFFDFTKKFLLLLTLSALFRNAFSPIMISTDVREFII